VTPFDHWRTLRAALTVTLAEVEAEYVRIGAEAFALYRRNMPAKKRAKMPGPPTSASEFASQSRVWHTALTEEARADLNPALEEMATRLRLADDRTVAARKALREAARVIPAAVVGERLAKWRLIREDWLTINGGSSHRSHAEFTAHDLMHLGYQVRCYARLHPEGHRSVTGPVRAFEVWAWTCDEGEQIARYQTPTNKVPEPPIRWVSLAADEELPAR
jgi:hypothetical protein